MRLDWLGTAALSWRDLLVIVRQSPRDSAIVRAIDPDTASWALPEHLLAEAVDTLRWLQWAKTEDGAKGRRRPKPIPRPGVTDEDVTTTHFGSEPVSLDDLNAFLGWSEWQPPDSVGAELN